MDKRKGSSVSTCLPTDFLELETDSEVQSQLNDEGIYDNINHNRVHYFFGRPQKEGRPGEALNDLNDDEQEILCFREKPKKDQETV